MSLSKYLALGAGLAASNYFTFV